MIGLAHSLTFPLGPAHAQQTATAQRQRIYMCHVQLKQQQRWVSIAREHHRPKRRRVSVFVAHRAFSNARYDATIAQFVRSTCAQELHHARGRQPSLSTWLSKVDFRTFDARPGRVHKASQYYGWHVHGRRMCVYVCVITPSQLNHSSYPAAIISVVMQHIEIP